jgi:hypothetical protein
LSMRVRFTIGAKSWTIVDGDKRGHCFTRDFQAEARWVSLPLAPGFECLRCDQYRSRCLCLPQPRSVRRLHLGAGNLIQVKNMTAEAVSRRQSQAFNRSQEKTQND